MVDNAGKMVIVSVHSILLRIRIIETGSYF